MMSSMVGVVFLHALVLGKLCEALSTSVGDTVYLQCTTSSPYPSWSGPPIINNTSSRYNYPNEAIFSTRLGEKKDRLKWENTKNLMVVNINRADSGLYCCEVNMSLQCVTVFVRVPPHTVEIINALNYFNILTIQGTEEAELQLTCKSSGGYPEQTVLWYKGSSLLTSNKFVVNDTATETVNVTVEAIITPHKNDDGGEYICVSTFLDDPKLNVSIKGRLHLNLKPSSPMINLLAPVKENENQRIAICNTYGFRPSESFSLTWLFRNTNTSYMETPSENNATKTFSVSSTYTSQMTREDNNRALTCSVTHLTLPTPSAYSVNVQVQFSPLVTTIMGNVTNIADGINTIMLTCRSGTSNPVSSIFWYINNINTARNGTSSIKDSEFGGKQIEEHLILTPTRKNDGDIVICGANNSVSEGKLVTDNITLNLLYSPLIKTLSNVIVVEGNFSLLECAAVSKPPSTFRWYKEKLQIYQGNGTVNDNRAVYNITRVSRADTGTYMCIADNGIQASDNKSLTLTVYYPPNVTVEFTTVNANRISVKCKPNGVPSSNYTYGKWLQIWPGYGVVYERIGSPTFDIFPLTYEDSGIYECNASNTVKVFGTQKEYIEGSNYLLVKSLPIVTKPNVSNSEPTQISGKLNSTTAMDVEFYTNLDVVDVNCYKVVNGSRQSLHVCTTHLKNITVNLPVHSHIVSADGKRATISIPIKTIDDFGFYHVIVSNEEGFSFVEVDVIPQGVPNTPTQFIHLDEKVTVSSLTLQWTPGFNGGPEQTFVLRYRKMGTQKWTSVYINDLGETVMIYELQQLSSGTQYEIELFATNSIGPSAESLNITASTAVAASPPGVSGAIIGGAVGGGTVLALTVVVAVVFIRRLRIKSGTDTSRLAENKMDRQHTEEDSSDEDVVVENKMYESAGQIMTRDEPVYNKPTKKVKVDTKNTDVYAVVDKSKTKENQTVKKEKPNKKKQLATGDIYENAPKKSTTGIETYGNAAFEESPYENPEGSKPSQPSKKNMNKDGLIYADLAFNDQPKGQKKLVIHGIDEMTTYVQVDFNRKADPLPDSDTEEQSENKKK